MMYFREGEAQAHPPRLATIVAIGIAALFVVLFGLYPSILLRLTTTVF
jgi:hypothetical protein